MEKKYYAYYHVRLDKNHVFYVGVGTKQKTGDYSRSKNKVGKNAIWKNIVNKSKWKAVIIKEFDTKLESLIYETRLIQMFGRIIDGGQLANIVKDSTDNFEMTAYCGESHWKPIYQYSMSGEYLNEYASVTKAAEVIKCNSNQLSMVATKNKGYSKGFQWRYEKVDRLEPISLKEKIIYQYDLEGNFIKEWKSSVTAAKELNISNKSISAAVRNKSHSAGNFQWSYHMCRQIPLIQKFKRNITKRLVYQYDKNYNLINTFHGTVEAEKCTKVSSGNISSCCRGKYKTAGGFIWSYEPLTDKCQLRQDMVIFHTLGK